MKIFQTEFGYSYGTTYSFGYTSYAELEPGDDAGEAYERGFLPCSTNPRVHNLFYMARGVRVLADRFSPSSENRRVLKKFDGAFTIRVLDREELFADGDFRSQFLDYFEKKHGKGVMSPERVEGYFKSVLPVRGIRYEKNGVPVGYVLEITGKDWAHYWYSCYASARIGTSLGMWLMLDAVRRAQTEGRSRVYLGTAYGDKGRYKTNFSPLEFWDGATWNGDEALLKRYIREDAERKIPFGDRFNTP